MSEEQRLTVFDGYAGFGGASEAFVIAKDRVLRVDNNPALDGSVDALMIGEVDSSAVVEQLHQLRAHADIDLMIFGPPCLEFSQAFSAPNPVQRREGIIPFPDLSLLERAVRMIEIHKPRFWIIENVVGAIPYFQPYLGRPQQIIGPFCLWGNFPLISADLDGFSKYQGDPGPGNPLRANHRARWPLVLSAGLRRAITEGHLTLGDF